MSGRVEIRPEAADGPAARQLHEEYMALVCERLPGFVPSERIFASEEVFGRDGGAWLVAYDAGGEPVGCGGLRTLAPGVGEIKRMFVVERARGVGLGRRLLRELERRAAAQGLRRVRLLTTEVLSEAIALYDAEGYRAVERSQRAGEPVEIWMEKVLG
ncbi:MAG TPA: GNAT family N-acetyltransferase [Solirubrobacteraceae bacterium]|jgi:GNAT superfamily N-acetyltransferase